ncbi:hypothetical protein [Tengunoibacter tsumagoiensis]|uniref:Lipoprotein n=1 Tax=Tengunoibacter tsumagoiensis TaxID=2014871 RepID=A0A401ZVH7_9CHLR|nr:hypothetical protein [Tengunoibacter tsumagoiensis]GCE10796.1 hypothetical protein KTT_06550 [Tengunoibacter tsumagoiensis]
MNMQLRSYISHLLFACICLVIALSMVACGAQGEGSASPTPTPTATTAVPITTTAGITIVGQNCGKVSVRPNGSLDAQQAPGDVSNCFWKAFQSCQSATMMFVVGGIDTLTTRAFTVQKQAGTCKVSEAVQHSIAPRPANSTTINSCADIIKSADKLTFHSCGEDGTVEVPLKNA